MGRGNFNDVTDLFKEVQKLNEDADVSIYQNPMKFVAFDSPAVDAAGNFASHEENQQKKNRPKVSGLNNFCQRKQLQHNRSSFSVSC